MFLDFGWKITKVPQYWLYRGSETHWDMSRPTNGNYKCVQGKPKAILPLTSAYWDRGSLPPPVEVPGSGTVWAEPNPALKMISDVANFRPISPRSWEKMSFASSQGNLFPATVQRMIPKREGEHEASRADAQQNQAPTSSLFQHTPLSQPGEGDGHI